MERGMREGGLRNERGTGIGLNGHGRKPDAIRAHFGGWWMVVVGQ